MPDAKFVPVAVSVNPAEPAMALAGEMELSVGVAALMVKAREEVSFPAAVCTATVAVPGMAMSVAGTVAVSCVVDTNVVVSALAFHTTTSPETKFAPLTVMVKPAPPAVAPVGEMEFSVGGAELIVKVSAPVLLPAAV